MRLRVFATVAALLVADPGLACAQAADAPELVFRRQVTAVLPGAVLLADDGNGVRRLALGEVWRDGWRLEAVNERAASLRRGAEVRSVDLSAWPAGERALEAGPLTLTNARLGGSPAVAAELGPTSQLVALMEMRAMTLDSMRVEYDRLLVADDPRAAEARRFLEEAERSLVEELRSEGFVPAFSR